MAARSDLPTLTEVIDLRKTNPGAYEPTTAMPIQDESVPMEESALGTLRLRTPGPSQGLAQDEELVAQVLVRLQPRLEAWVEAKVRIALTELLPPIQNAWKAPPRAVRDAGERSDAAAAPEIASWAEVVADIRGFLQEPPVDRFGGHGWRMRRRTP